MPEEMDDQFKQIALDLGTTSIETIEVFVQEAADPDIYKEIFDANKNRTEVIKLLYDHPNTPDEVRALAAGVLSLPVIAGDDEKLAKRRAAEQKAREQQQKENLMGRIAKMPVSAKVKLALKGNSEARGLLIKEANKVIVMAVLENPRITDGEVANAAKNTNIVEDALRKISRHKEWSKNPNIQYSLVHNPKTPPGISMKYVPYLKKKDIAMLSKNKNVPEAVRTLAKKLSKAKAEG